MKIFNWVHRRFTNNKEKNGDMGADEKQIGDENKCNIDVFERWGGGILTIGTFGYDSLKDESDEQTVCDDLLCQEDLEIEMVESDGVSETDDHKEEEINEDYDEDEEEEDEKSEDLIEEEKVGFEYVMMEKKERTTLAELFSVDFKNDDFDDMKMIKNQSLKKMEMAKEDKKFKRASSIKKKLKMEEPQPMHKLNQLMRKMLKRKIHPAIGADIDINCHASLLPTPESMLGQ